MKILEMRTKQSVIVYINAMNAILSIRAIKYLLKTVSSKHAYRNHTRYQTRSLESENTLISTYFPFAGKERHLAGEENKSTCT